MGQLHSTQNQKGEKAMTPGKRIEPQRKLNYLTLVSPAITILILFAGFNYSRGQQQEQAKKTQEQATECKAEIKSIKEDQARDRKETLKVLQQIMIELAEVKTELKMIRKNN